MLWLKGRRSSNIEDRRGMGLPSKMVGGGICTIILILAAPYSGFDPSVFCRRAQAH
jgi:uncharacterized protein